MDEPGGDSQRPERTPDVLCTPSQQPGDTDRVIAKLCETPRPAAVPTRERPNPRATSRPWIRALGLRLPAQPLDERFAHRIIQAALIRLQHVQHVRPRNVIGQEPPRPPYQPLIRPTRAGCTPAPASRRSRSPVKPGLKIYPAAVLTKVRNIIVRVPIHRPLRRIAQNQPSDTAGNSPERTVRAPGVAS